MKHRTWILSALCLTGCMASNSLQYEAVAETNLYRIARTRKGMNEKEVLSIMHKPYSYETFVSGDDVYDVWFYVTQTTGLDQTRMVPQNLTPLTFKNGILVGSGYSWYYYAMKEQAAEMALRTPPEPKAPSQEELDKEFEKKLRDPSTKIENPPVQPTTSAETPPLPALSAEPEKEIAKWVPPQAVVPRKQFSQVQVGMTETEVTNLIGTPDSYTAYRIKGDIYDILFYEITSGFGGTKKMPLTFKNSVLVSTSENYYQEIKKAAQPTGPAGYTREADQMQEAESEQNFNFW